MACCPNHPRMHTINKLIRNHETEVETLKETVGQRDDVIEQFKHDMAGKDKIIASRDKSIAIRDKNIATRDKVIASQDNIIDMKDEQIRIHMATIAVYHHHRRFMDGIDLHLLGKRTRAGTADEVDEEDDDDNNGGAAAATDDGPSTVPEADAPEAADDE